MEFAVSIFGVVGFSPLPDRIHISVRGDRTDHSDVELFFEEIATMPVIGDRPELNLKTVIYATDFSLCSRNAGLYAARMAAYFSAKLLVTHAFTLEQAALEVEVGDRRLSQQRQNLTHLLSREADFLGANSIEIVPTLSEGNPEDVIPDLANKHEPSMIVLGTHGGGRLERRNHWLGRGENPKVHPLAGAYRWTPRSALVSTDVPLRENSFCDRLY